MSAGQVRLVKPAVDGCGALLHFGNMVAPPDEAGPPLDFGALASAADAVAAAPSSAAGSSSGEGVTMLPVPVVGSVVMVAVSPQRRQRAASLHSAGHLLDQAMSNIGQALPAGKGYHFEDGTCKPNT